MPSIADKIKKLISTHGITVYISTITSVGEEIDCPCTDNPWKMYDKTWHLTHKDELDCQGTGVLIKNMDENPVVEKKAIRGFIFPNYEGTSREFDDLIGTKNYRWAWVCVTQDTASFNMIWIENAQGNIIHKFIVRNDMPMYIDNNTTVPVVIFYVLLPVSKG